MHSWHVYYSPHQIVACHQHDHQEVVSSQTGYFRHSSHPLLRQTLFVVVVILTVVAIVVAAVIGIVVGKIVGIPQFTNYGIQRIRLCQVRAQHPIHLTCWLTMVKFL
jgi:type III secretory pathway component EscS